MKMNRIFLAWSMIKALVYWSPVLLAFALSCHGGDWPRFLGPDRNGIAKGETLIIGENYAGPKLLWKKDAGAGFSGPAVVGDRLIRFYRQGDRERAECLTADSGESVWVRDDAADYRDDFGFDNGPRATPTVDRDKVFTFGANGALSCLDLETGEVLWRVDARTRFAAEKGFFGFASSPLAVGDRLIVQVGGKKGGVVAFDISNGSIDWTATQDEAGYASPILVSWKGKSRILAWTRERLLLLNPSDGKILKEFPFRSRMHASVNGATPLHWDGSIFLSASYGAGAVLLSMDGDGSGFATRWREDDLLSNHYATSIYYNGFLYGFHGRQEYGADLRCVDVESGETRWEKGGLGMGSLTLVDGKLLALTENGELIVVEARSDSFRILHRAQVAGAGVRAYPAYADGVIYLRDTKAMYAYDLQPE